MNLLRNYNAAEVHRPAPSKAGGGAAASRHALYDGQQPTQPAATRPAHLALANLHHILEVSLPLPLPRLLWVVEKVGGQDGQVVLRHRGGGPRWRRWRAVAGGLPPFAAARPRGGAGRPAIQRVGAGGGEARPPNKGRHNRGTRRGGLLHSAGRRGASHRALAPVGGGMSPQLRPGCCLGERRRAPGWWAGALLAGWGGSQRRAKNRRRGENSRSARLKQPARCRRTARPMSTVPWRPLRSLCSSRHGFDLQHYGQPAFAFNRGGGLKA